MQANHYVTLGVPPAATAAEIYAAYRKLALRHHPDRGGDTAYFATITCAYGVLKDAKRRRQYDAELKLLGKACRSCDGRGVRYVQRSFSQRKAIPCNSCKGTGQAV